jgi:hemolysin III
MSLKEKIDVPKYSLGEEIMSAITHGVGAILSIVALIMCVVFSAKNGSMISVISSIIYGTTLIILYTMSTLYHSLAVNNAKRVFRIIDHCSIFLLIAGTYTPFTLVALKKPLGYYLFAIIWAVAILGIVLNSINLKKYKVISFISYLILGWIIIFAYNPLKESVDFSGILLLLAGGIVYSVGALFYAFGRKVKYFHSVFHIFVLAGSILHFLSILLYVI